MSDCEQTKDELIELVEKQHEAIASVCGCGFTPASVMIKKCRDAASAYVTYKASLAPANPLGLPIYYKTGDGHSCCIYDHNDQRFGTAETEAKAAHLVKSANRDHLVEKMLEGITETIRILEVSEADAESGYHDLLIPELLALLSEAKESSC